MDGRIDDPDGGLEGPRAVVDGEHARAVPHGDRQGHDEQGDPLPAAAGSAGQIGRSRSHDLRGHRAHRGSVRHHLRDYLLYFRSGVSPERLLQSVAAGAFGRDAAFSGGAMTAAAGLGFHFFIAFTITAIFFAAASRLRWLTAHPLLSGAAYGIGVYAVMNWVVIPLSRIGPRPFPPASVFISGLLVHMFLIGATIAFGARRAAR